MLKLMAVVAAAGGVLLLPACGDSTDPTSVVATLQIQPDSIHLDMGDSVTLSVSALNADGALLTGVAVTFEVNDSTVAMVSAVGTVHAAGRGTTSVIARAANVSEQVPVVVVATPAGIALIPDSVVLEVWEERALTVVVVDKVGNQIPDAVVQLTSSDPSVASVSDAGVVTGVDRGTAIITATAGQESDVAVVKVVPTPAAVLLTPDTVTLETWTERLLAVEVYDRTGHLIFDPIVFFGSTDPSVATVSDAGLVTGVDVGTTLITATVGSLADTTAVEVVPGRMVNRIYIGGGPWEGAVNASGVGAVTLGTSNEVLFLDMAVQAAIGAPISVGSVPTQVTFSTDGATAYVSDQGSQQVSVVDVASRTVTNTISVTGSPVPMLVSGDDQILFICTDINRLYKIDLSTEIPTDSLDLPETSHHIAFGADSTLLYVATRDGGSVQEIDPATLTLVREFATTGRSQGLAISPDGQRLYVAIETGGVGVEVWDLTTGSRVRHIALDGPAFGLALNEDASRVYASLPYSGVVVEVDPATGAEVDRIRMGGGPWGVAFDAGTNTFMVANFAGSIDFFQ